MNIVPTLCLPLALAIFVWGGALHTQPSGNLQATLHALDESSAKFVSAQATFNKDLYTKLVNDHTMQDGKIYFKRVPGGTDAGIAIVGPGARIVEYKAGVLRDYNPGINCFDTISTTGRQGTVDTFLTLGFGGSGKDLAKAWNITDLGSETITDGSATVKVEKLDLVPKEQSVKANYSHVTLWLDLDRGVSLKQEGFEPNGDTQTAIYSNVKLNQRVDTAPFAIKGKPCK